MTVRLRRQHCSAQTQAHPPPFPDLPYPLHRNLLLADERGCRLPREQKIPRQQTQLSLLQQINDAL